MKRLLAALSSVLMVITLLITALPVHATVETWPAGVPNTPRNPDDIFIDFEKGVEGFEIESSVPSLKFTTTAGLNWAYGDIRTGQYNVYPYGSQLYETNGNFFAWLGVTGDSGRIDFVGGGATYCSVLVSTYSGLVIDAYDSDGTFIASSGWAANNTGTRTFTRLTVDAPAGKTIAYILIHDTGNYWLIDDLCTDANKAVIPVPGRSLGSHGTKFDIVFVPDADYGSQADIDTWLPVFLTHINDQIDQRLGGKEPVTGNLGKFNFYYTRMQGTASSKTLPANMTLYAPFADAFVIFHNAVFGDSTSMGTPSIYGAEGPVGRSFIHESGHGIFKLADEYDGCNTFYFQPNPYPNIWSTQAIGRTDASAEYRTAVTGESLGTGDGNKTVFGPVLNVNSANATTFFFADIDIDGDIDNADIAVYINGAKQATGTYSISTIFGTIIFTTAPPASSNITIDYSYVKDNDWNPINIGKFTNCQDDWWKLGTAEYIMLDGERFNNGWGKPAERRIKWFLGQFTDAGKAAEKASSATEGNSIWLNLEVASEVFSLLGDSFVTDSPPNYLPGTYDFTVQVYSTSGALLGTYGVNDPRRIIAESDYNGPTWLENLNFQLIVPYFDRGGRVDLTESSTGTNLISIDISKYANPSAPDSTPPNLAMVSPPSGSVLQKVVDFVASVTDSESGVASVTFSIRKDDGGSGVPVGFEDLAPSFDPTSGTATLTFNTAQLSDDNYLVVVRAVDNEGNSASITVPYSIRNRTARIATGATIYDKNAPWTDSFYMTLFNCSGLDSAIGTLSNSTVYINVGPYSTAIAGAKFQRKGNYYDYSHARKTSADEFLVVKLFPKTQEIYLYASNVTIDGIQEPMTVSVGISGWSYAFMSTDNWKAMPYAYGVKYVRPSPAD